MIGHPYTVVTHVPAEQHVSADTTHGTSASAVLTRWMHGYASGYEPPGVLEVRVTRDDDPGDAASAVVEIYEAEGIVRWRVLADEQAAAA